MDLSEIVDSILVVGFGLLFSSLAIALIVFTYCFYEQTMTNIKISQNNDAHSVQVYKVN